MKKERELAELILDTFRKTNSKANHIVMMRTLNLGVFPKLNPKEQELIYTVLNGLTSTGYYTYEKDSECIRLTEKGYDYIYDDDKIASMQSKPWVIPTADKTDWDKAYFKLWKIIGPRDSAIHYFGGSKFYKLIMDLCDDIPPSYSQFIEHRRNKELSTSRVDYYKDLINHLDEKNRMQFYIKAQLLIEDENDIVTTTDEFSFDTSFNPINDITEDVEPMIENTPSSIMNILIVTATDKETSAVLNKAEQMLDKTAEASIQGDHAVSFLGTIKSSKIWHAQCEAGTGGPSGSQAIVTDLIVALNPKYVLMPGIAFGLDESKQKIGDILISTHVCTYEKQRVGQKETIQRGEKVPSSPSLLSTLRMVKQKWKKADMHFGIIMSGEKLVDNPALVAQLKEIQPEAIGGEMEGAGLYAAAYRKKTDWILFKSIVDWGMGKTDEFQNDSSLFASEVLFETLNIIVV